jgi:hypothetical protein
VQEIDAIERELITLVGEYAPRVPITPQSAFYQDLFVVGDDLYEIIIEIVKQHGTSFEGFCFDRYAPNEATAFFYYIATGLGYCKNSFPPLTIEHLAKVVERGEWFEP